MRFRPRYSLLTLLVLTAIVAGGANFWFGEHRVVETKDSVFHREKEYTYTRTWDGQKILQGPMVVRLVNQDTHFRETTVAYYRQGKQLPWHYQRIESTELQHWRETKPPARQDNPMSDEEYTEFQRAIQREKQRTLRPGVKEIEFERASLAFLEEPSLP